MFLILQVVTIFLAAVVMSLALAHVLEFPGKMRLDKQTYIVVQSIYYPGFTIGGFSEPLAIAAAIALLLVEPRSSPAFYWTLVGLLSLVAVQGVYWLVTHPANKF